MSCVRSSLFFITILAILTSTSVYAHGAESSPKVHKQKTGQIIGSITCNDQAASGVLLYVPGESFSVRTADDGTFRIHYVPRGRYSLRGKIPKAGNFTIPEIKVKKHRITDLGTLEICSDNGNGGEPPNNLSGTYNITPVITYTCAYGIYNIDISDLQLQIVGTTLTVLGTPVQLTGTITNGSFNAQGILPGTVPETYTLNGSFIDMTTWTGMLNVTFGGQVSLTDCVNQTFDITGVHADNGEPTSPTMLSGVYSLTPIIYSCYFGIVNINLSEFEFQVINSELTVLGAPTAMTGTISNDSFAVIGSVPGTVTETYRVDGTLTSENSWSGIFQIQFSGSVGISDCTNQAFDVDAVHVTVVP